MSVAWWVSSYSLLVKIFRINYNNLLLITIQSLMTALSRRPPPAARILLLFSSFHR